MKTTYSIQQSNIACLLTLTLTYDQGESEPALDPSLRYVPPEPREYTVIYYGPGDVRVDVKAGETKLQHFDIPVQVKAYIIDRFDQVFSEPIANGEREAVVQYHKAHDAGSPNAWRYDEFN